MKSQLLQDIDESASLSRPAAAPHEPETYAEASDPEPAEAGASPFASERPDWVGAQVESKPHWFDRWGRRAAIWSAGLTLASLLAAGGLWMYQERSIDRTLVLVAKSSLPAPRSPSSAVAAAPAAPRPDAPLERPAIPVAAPPAAEAPAVAASSEPEPIAPKPEQAQQKRSSTKPRPKAPVAVVESESTHTAQLAETLRQCRAMGYHATQCLKRGCVTTRYGLACRG